MLSPMVQIGQGTKLWYPELSNIGNCVIGEDCTIHSHVWISDGVRIGNRVKIQAFTFIPDGVLIDDDVFIGPRVTFTNDPKMAMTRDGWKPTIICKGAKIGAGAIIIAGVTIGQDAVIGAGSVVTKSIKRGQTAYGVPAKVIEVGS